MAVLGKNKLWNPWLGILFYVFLLLPFSTFPISFRDFWFTKWGIVYCFSMLASLWFIWSPSIVVPKLSKQACLLIASLFCYHLLSCYLHDLSFVGSALLDRLCFVILTILFFNLFYMEILTLRDFFIILAVSSCAYIIWCVPLFSSVFHDMERKDLLSLGFGNINMSAEYVVMALIAQLCLSSLLESKIAKIALTGLFVLSILFCYLAQSRSIYLIIILSIMVMFFWGRMKENYCIKWGIVLSILIIAGVEGLKYFKLIWQNDQLIQTSVIHKQLGDRLSLFYTTLLLIKDHPWGVGPGQYEFAMIPYFSHLDPYFNDTSIVYSPHNELLRFLAEDGIPYVLLSLGLVYALVKGKGEQIIKTLREDTFLPLFIIYLCVQGMFQFPLQNAFPFLVTTMAFGYGLTKIYNETILLNSFGLAKHGLSSTTIFIGIAVLLSEYLTYNYSYSSHHNQIAYKLNPANWYSAIYKAEADISLNNIEGAKKILHKELDQRPYNFVAMKLMARIYELEGLFEKRCAILIEMDNYFANKSQYHSFIQSHCFNNRVNS